MAAQKISELTELAEAPADNDVFPVVDTSVGSTKKLTAANLKSGLLKASNNLSDISSASTARTNLGLGDSATKNTGTAAGTVAAGDHTHTSAAVSDFTEAAQDAVGAALTDSASVDFTYNDGANTISATVIDNSSTQKVAVAKAGTTAGTRAEVNFIEGSNVTITVADNGVSDRVDVTIASTGGGGGGSGDVTGPASSTSGNVATFNGTTGKIIQDGGKALPTGAIVGTTDTQTLTNKTLTTPTIADLTNATHSHQNNAGGGTLDGAAIAAGTVAAARLGTMTGDSGSGGAKGAVPAPAAGDAAAGKFLKADGTWATPSGGGGGSPGGSDTQVQFNDAGALGGDAGFTYAKATDTATIGAIKTGVGSASTNAVQLGFADTGIYSFGSGAVVGMSLGGRYHSWAYNYANIERQGGYLRIGGNGTNDDTIITGDDGGTGVCVLNPGFNQTLAVRNGTNSQKQHIYHTYTNTSNYQRLGLNNAAGYVEIGAESAGTGAANIDVQVTPKGTGAVKNQGQYYSPEFVLTDGATIALDWKNGNVQSVTLAGNRTFTFANPKAGARYLLLLTQDATGSRTITWPTIKWQGGASPTLTTTANKTDLIALVYSGSSYYAQASLNFS